MNALTKFSIALLLITASAIAAYLFLAPSDEGYDAARSQPQGATSSQPQDGICKQDEERLARLRANPSLDEGLSFVSEIRCLRLWPQLQTIMEGLSNPSRPTSTSRPSGADTIPASDSASAPGTTSAALDDACKHDENRLAELRANPSVEAAVRFDSELKCPGLQPQLPAILKQLSKAGTVEAANHQLPAPDPMSTRGAAPTASLPPTPEVTSATSDDACRRDEERLGQLQAKPSVEEAVRFEDELKCSRLQVQVLALLDSLSQAPQSAAAPTADGAPPGATSAGEAMPPSSEPAPQTESATGALSPDGVPSSATIAGEAAPPASEPPATEAKPAAGALSPNGAPPDTASAGAAVPRTPERSVSEATSGARPLSSSEAPLNTASADAADTDSTREAAPSPSATSESAASDEPANPPPTLTGTVSNEARDATNAVNDDHLRSQAIADAETRIAALESDKEALAAEVSRLQHDREAPSTEQAAPTPSPPASPAERSEAEAASQAAAEAARRIAELESEKVALTAEVSKLQRDREEQSKPIPPSPSAAPTERSDAEPAAALASLPEGMPARVLIRYLKNNADARAQAEKLASALATQDVEVADVRESRSAIRTELSFCYAPDETIGRQVGRVVGLAPVRRLQSKDGLMVRPGTLELNLSGDSHLAVIKTTSTRERNHE
jgi:hypothetical protein